MKHTLYALEKKQFHLEGYWLFAGVLFFCYVLSIQMNMQTIYLDLQNGRIPDSVKDTGCLQEFCFSAMFSPSR